MMFQLHRVKVAALIACMGSPLLVAQESPTWSSDVAAIVYRSCASCHRPGQPAPFSLLSYDDVFKKRTFVAEVTALGYMPPWQPTHGDFAGDRRLNTSS